MRLVHGYLVQHKHCEAFVAVDDHGRIVGVQSVDGQELDRRTAQVMAGAQVRNAVRSLHSVRDSFYDFGVY
jgi:hypothetical protein